jgi:hypothetical protein
MFTVALDTRAFDAALGEYMTYQKRLPADVINAKLMFVARNATMTTKAAHKGNIDSELRGPSRDVPGVPLGAILANIDRKRKGLKGVSGAAMASAMEKLIRSRIRSVNFVRSGWKQAIVTLESYLRATGEMKFVRRKTAPVDGDTMRRKRFKNLGKATVAKIYQQGRVWGEIQNDVTGQEGKDLGALEQVKSTGLQLAVDKEAASMRWYIEQKLNPVHKDFNRKQGL